MFDEGFSRRDVVVAIGGGLITDLVAFAATIYMRGIVIFIHNRNQVLHHTHYSTWDRGRQLRGKDWD